MYCAGSPSGVRGAEDVAMHNTLAVVLVATFGRRSYWLREIAARCPRHGAL